MKIFFTFILALAFLLGIMGCSSPRNEEETDETEYTTEEPTPAPEHQTMISIPAGLPHLALHVATDGCDTGDGSVDRPFATLEQARDTIRELDRTGFSGATVYMRGGVYEIVQTFVLNTRDSGSEDFPITYTSFPGEVAVIYGGKVLPPEAFGPVTDPTALERIPPEALNYVRQISLWDLGIKDLGELGPSGYSHFRPPLLQLYTDGRLQTLARFPNGRDEILIREVHDRGRVFFTGGDTFHPDPGDPALQGGARFAYTEEDISAAQAAAWALELDHAFLSGGWVYVWAPDNVSIRDITHTEGVGGVIELAHTTTFGVSSNRFFFAYNLLSELDTPGEYFICRDTGLLFYFPHGCIFDEDLEIAVFNDAFILAHNTSHITFSNLYLAMGRGDGIVVNNGESMNIVGNVIRNMEKNAILLGRPGSNIGGGFNNRVDGNVIFNIGEHGIHAQSGPGDRRYLRMSNTEITNNEIFTFGQIVRTYRVAVNVVGNGFRIANNLIYDAPTHAIHYSGNDILIEYNVIFDVMQEQDDGGTIYSFGDYTFVNCIIRFNFIHSLYSRAEKHVGISAIYPDFPVGDVDIYGNVIVDVDGNGLLLNGGQRIRAFHNIMINITDRSIFNAAYGTYIWSCLHTGVPGWEDRYAHIWFNNRRAHWNAMRPWEEPWASTYPWVQHIFSERWEPRDPAAYVPEGCLDYPENVAQMPGDVWDPERSYLSREPYSYWLPVGSETFENVIINGHPNRNMAFMVDRPNTGRWNEITNFWSWEGHFYDIGSIRDNQVSAMGMDELTANFRDPANGDFTLLPDSPILQRFPDFRVLDFDLLGPQGVTARQLMDLQAQRQETPNLGVERAEVAADIFIPPNYMTAADAPVINLNEAIANPGGWVGSGEIVQTGDTISFASGSSYTYDVPMNLVNTWITFYWQADSITENETWPGFAIHSGGTAGQPFWTDATTMGYSIIFKRVPPDNPPSWGNAIEVQRIVGLSSTMLTTDESPEHRGWTVDNEVITEAGRMYFIEWGVFFGPDGANIIVRVDGSEIVNLVDPNPPSQLGMYARFWLYHHAGTGDMMLRSVRRAE